MDVRRDLRCVTRGMAHAYDVYEVREPGGFQRIDVSRSI